MAGRGRGRGRGSSMSINLEQLGFQRGEVLPGQLQPPPHFPPLGSRPIPLTLGLEQDYLSVVRKEFQSYMRDSPHYIVAAVKKPDIERYVDKLTSLTSKNAELKFNWKRFPDELKPTVGKKRKVKSKVVKPNVKVQRKSETVDVSGKLEKLAEKEKDESDVESTKESDKDDDDEQEGEEIEDDDEVDEEMDQGTDYANAYFDNGESYLDEEDDNLDDGPTY